MGVKLNTRYSCSIHKYTRKRDATNTCHALIEDARDENRDLIEDAFKRAGHRCDTARDGIAATNLVSIYDDDLVIIDLATPKMNGPKLVQALQARPCPPMIVVLAGGKPPARERPDHAGRVDQICS